MKGFLQKTIKAGLYLLLLTPLFLIKGTYFPFVFSKAVYFQVLVEFLLFLYLILIFLEPTFRPKIGALSAALLIYFAVLALTTITALCPTRAFWSTQERMTGLFNLLHLGGFFILLKAMFKTKKEWLRFFRFFVFVAVVVALLSFFRLKAKTPSPLGNPGFLATYLLFSVFFGLFLCGKDKNIFLRGTYLFLIALSVFLMYEKERRAGLAALFVGVFTFSFLKALSFKGKKRWLAFGMVLLLLAGLFLVARGVILKEIRAQFLRGSKPREISWGISWSAFKEKPFLGWGPGNYLYAFSKNFNPEYARYTKRWFDKAHNEFLEALTTSGVFGFFSYVSLFVLSGLKLLRKKEYALFSLIPAYVFNNLFWFDVTSTLIPLFVLFAFSEFEQKNKKKEGREAGNLKFLPLLLIPLLFVSFYLGNLKPFRASKALARGEFEEAISLNTFVSYEARKELAEVARKSEDAEVVLFARREIEEAVRKRPEDPKLYIHLTYLRFRLGDLEGAIEAAENALESAPQRPDLKELLSQVEKEAAK